ncbi:hypothetical protein [Microbispora catharanthi]|uniref:Uncharacterized protein n=1 Tax=Microbispora catharanthi TaxID=1712871 RepID=A0A5N6BI92_9ACTN|nr:hypothetical protein [Microbispora catharanthi]KAB8180145.1 hypothetical protein FH610_034535 [Microbispora catharanthi]
MPEVVLWIATAVSIGIFILRFSLLMPTKKFRWRIPLAALMGVLFVLVTAMVGAWPMREALGYLSAGFIAVSLASVGQGAGIRRWAWTAHEKGEPETLQPGQLMFAVKILMILGVMLYLKTVLVSG